MTEQLNEEKNRRSFQQETLAEIFEAEKLGIDCTALKLHILQLDAMGFKPKEHVIFEQD